MFGFLKNKADQIAQRYSGKTDLLEGVCAVAALVTVADGEIEDEEVVTAIDTIKGHKVLGAAYKTHQIEQTFDTMLKRAKTTSGRISVRRELDDVQQKGDRQLCEDVFAIGVDVALADGQVEPQEKVVLIDCAKRLGVKPEDFGL